MTTLSKAEQLEDNLLRERQKSQGSSTTIYHSLKFWIYLFYRKEIVFNFQSEIKAERNALETEMKQYEI